MKTPRAVGFLQAVGIALYVSGFASIIAFVEQSAFFKDFDPSFPLGPIMFLLAFIISATTCSLLMFGYPFYLFMHEKKKEALHIVLWSVGWLALIFLVVLVSTLLLFA
jgi:hypothetical protein